MQKLLSGAEVRGPGVVAGTCARVVGDGAADLGLIAHALTSCALLVSTSGITLPVSESGMDLCKGRPS